MIPATEESHEGLEISIIVPSYNEDESLSKMVSEVIHVYLQTGWSFEILVNDDGSTDRTVDVIEKLCKSHPELVRYVRHRQRLGMGAALITGFANARGEVIVELPGDKQFDPCDTVQMVKIRGDFDGVIGMVKTESSFKLHRLQFLRTILSKGLRMLIRIMHPNIPSITGILVVRRDLVDPSQLLCASPFAHLEILDNGRRRGARFTTAPNTVRPRIAGTTKVTNLSTIISMVVDMIRLRWYYTVSSLGLR